MTNKESTREVFIPPYTMKQRNSLLTVGGQHWPFWYIEEVATGIAVTDWREGKGEGRVGAFPLWLVHKLKDLNKREYAIWKEQRGVDFREVASTGRKDQGIDTKHNFSETPYDNSTDVH